MQKAKSESRNLMVLDVMMDTMSSGFDMARELKGMDELRNTYHHAYRHWREDRVNFKSAFGNTDMLPVDAYLSKPEAPHLLVAEIERLFTKVINRNFFLTGNCREHTHYNWCAQFLMSLCFIAYSIRFYRIGSTGFWEQVGLVFFDRTAADKQLFAYPLIGITVAYKF